MMNEKVTTIMTPSPITVGPSASLEEVKDIFMARRVHHLAVVQAGELLGLVTTYDLWQQDENFKDYSSIAVEEIMTTKLAKISPNDKVGTAAELFLNKNIHALPVVGEYDQLLGIVTSFDILRYSFRKAYPRPILFAEVYYSGQRQAAS
jgi:CBS domain-containing protein